MTSLATKTTEADPGRRDASRESDPKLPEAERLRVLVIAACPFPANHGTPGSIRELAEGAAELGHEVHVACYAMGEATPLRGVEIHRIRDLTGERDVVVGPTRRKPFYDAQLVALALRLIYRHKIDVVHAHGYEAVIAAAICKLVSRRPVVYSAHNQMGDELASYKFFPYEWMAKCVAWVLDRLAPARADVCVPHSENLHRFLTDRGLGDRTEAVVNFGADFSRFPRGDREEARRWLGVSADQPVVMYTGVLDAFQRIDLLLEAMRRVVHALPEAKLVLVTSVPQESHIEVVLEQAKRLGVDKHLIVTKPVPYERVWELLAASDVTVTPRPAAVAFPIKLLNYMAARRPTVMYRSSASGVTHGENIWLVEPDSGEALGEGLLKLLSDVALAERLAATAYRFVRENHNRRDAARRVSDAFRRALSGRKRRGGVVGDGVVGGGDPPGTPVSPNQPLEGVHA